MFYLVMPKDQSSAPADESSTDELTHPENSHHTHRSVCSSPFIIEEEEPETPCLSPADPSLTGTLSRGQGLDQSQASTQRHVIKNSDQIFNTMEELMRKLQHLRDIEADHHTLLKTLRQPVPADEAPGGVVCRCPAAARMPSLDRGAGDGKEGVSTESAQPEIQSTGF
ncbi:rho guanine nucleotide exchange factor 11 [Rhinichthys klamathensis goyatoka]|uniref:rho guanine nucleotide exchange factor 11 n=1 Tax=Rhinichthys klamathensis goyatoka TaxID=3034132 RepID=UPI0024B4E774|nr:rho guanine nucleotide exchange factor 11 [Rhinichthys klamathensis goyatoka]